MLGDESLLRRVVHVQWLRQSALSSNRQCQVLLKLLVSTSSKNGLLLSVVM